MGSQCHGKRLSSVWQRLPERIVQTVTSSSNAAQPSSMSRLRRASTRSSRLRGLECTIVVWLLRQSKATSGAPPSVHPQQREMQKAKRRQGMRDWVLLRG